MPKKCSCQISFVVIFYCGADKRELYFTGMSTFLLINSYNQAALNPSNHFLFMKTHFPQPNNINPNYSLKSPQPFPYFPQNH